MYDIVLELESSLYEPLLQENERDAVTDLLRFLESKLAYLILNFHV